MRGHQLLDLTDDIRTEAKLDDTRSAPSQCAECGSPAGYFLHTAEGERPVCLTHLYVAIHDHEEATRHGA